MEPLSADDPRQIGEFSLRSRLGAGGMGRVYLAFSPGGRAVAMKVVHPGLAADPEFLRRFRNEVAAARAVSGMYTAPVVGAGIDDDPPWLATAYVPGPPLAEVVSRYGPLPETAVWRLAAGLTEALRAVHACGLVHRDLKPGNVLLAADGPHVIDFGISRAFEGTSVTSTGMVVGTPGYMSPEQAEGQQVGPPSDVFSLGCVLAYAATGNAPFGGGSAASILYRVVTAEPDLSGVPANLRQVITACLAKNPAERIGLAQLGPMIAALGPAMPGTLGSFWPEPLASIVAADNTHPVTQVSGSPFSPPPGSAPPSSQAPVSGAPFSAAQSGWNSAVAGGQACPAPAQPGITQQGIAQPGPLPGPQGATPGVTGHAPMVVDGYYAAAAYGIGAANPARTARRPQAPRRSSLNTRSPSTRSLRSSRAGRRSTPSASSRGLGSSPTPPCRPPHPRPSTRLSTRRHPGRSKPCRHPRPRRHGRRSSSSSRPPVAPGPGPGPGPGPASPADLADPATPARQPRWPSTPPDDGGVPQRQRFRPPCSARSG